MIYFLIAFLVIMIALIVRGVFLSRKKRLALYDFFLKDFGRKSVKKYKSGKKHINAIYKRFTPDIAVDDITWNDLDMDSVFERIDKCRSAVGEEYLYYLLRRQVSGGERGKLMRLVDSFSEDEKTRTEVLMSLDRIRYVKSLSPFDYIEKLTSSKTTAPIKHFILDFLFIPAILLIFLKPLFGGIDVFALIVVNILIYFRDKNSLEGMIFSIGFLIRLSEEGIRISEKNIPYINETDPVLKEETGLLKSIKNGGKYLSVSGQTGRSTGGGPFEILLTYINMIFHIDLIQYGFLLGKLSGKKESLQKILFLFGMLDSAISIADFRCSLAGNWCTPSFEPYDNDRKNVKIDIADGYHPLIENAVMNSVETDKGIILTGSNASGKSTFLRMVGINALLAQTIGTVCAGTYKAPVFIIYSSIALKDDLLKKESYFMVEIKSLKRIIDAKCDSYPALCFIDEVLRGTNTVERISASKTILSYLSRKNLLIFAATHDGELSDMLADEYYEYHFSENVEESDVVFDYKLKKGKAVTRNAIKLLRVYGYPGEIVSESEKMASKLDAKE